MNSWTYWRYDPPLPASGQGRHAANPAPGGGVRTRPDLGYPCRWLNGSFVKDLLTEFLYTRRCREFRPYRSAPFRK